MKPKVIIIDEESKGERRKAMIDAFRECADPYRYDCQKNEVRTDQKEKGIWVKEENVTQFDLMLIHGGDFDFKDKVNAGVRIWYGGYEGFDYRAENGEYQIHRMVTNPLEALTREEAQQIIDFIRGETQAPACFFSLSYNPSLEERVNFIHDQLLMPENIQWAQLDEQYGHLFADYPQAWKAFLENTNGIQKVNVQAAFFDEKYSTILDQLIEETINNTSL